MSESNWTYLTGSLAAGSVVRGASAGFVPPPGGDAFVFGFNSVDTTQGAVGLFCNQLSYAPMAAGGSITGCIKRGLSGGPVGFAPFFFLGLAGSSVGDTGYLLGLSDADPSRIILRKGAVNGGLSDLAPAPTTNGILRRSTNTVARDTWVHLRLDMIVNTNGDVRLVVFQSNLTTNPINSSPSWQPVVGMTDDNGGGVFTSFVDDALGVNSGSPAFMGGRGGFAFWTSDVTRRAYFDHIELQRDS